MSNVMMKCGCRANAVSIGNDGNDHHVCVIHDCYEIDTRPLDFTGRMAKCSYHSQCGSVEPSGNHLPFFEYRGPGSHRATEICSCGYYRSVHERSTSTLRDNQIKDHVFTPKGPSEFDSYYCGCRGWD